MDADYIVELEQGIVMAVAKANAYRVLAAQTHSAAIESMYYTLASAFDRVAEKYRHMASEAMRGAK